MRKRLLVAFMTAGLLGGLGAGLASVSLTSSPASAVTPLPPPNPVPASPPPLAPPKYPATFPSVTYPGAAASQTAVLNAQQQAASHSTGANSHAFVQIGEAGRLVGN